MQHLARSLPRKVHVLLTEPFEHLCCTMPCSGVLAVARSQSRHNSSRHSSASPSYLNQTRAEVCMTITLHQQLRRTIGRTGRLPNFGALQARRLGKLSRTSLAVGGRSERTTSTSSVTRACARLQRLLLGQSDLICRDPIQATPRHRGTVLTIHAVGRLRIRQLDQIMICHPYQSLAASMKRIAQGVGTDGLRVMRIAARRVGRVHRANVMMDRRRWKRRCRMGQSVCLLPFVHAYAKHD